MQIAYEKETLENGLDVIVHEDHSCPIVAVSVWYHVGSKNEQSGLTGFAGSSNPKIAKGELLPSTLA